MTQTTNLGLKKIDGGDNWRQIFDDHNHSMDLVDEAVASNTAKIENLESVKPVLSVNNVEPDASGSVKISTVDYAYGIASDDSQSSEGTFIDRTTGGSASIADGNAWLATIRGTRIHNGYVAESINMTVENAQRTGEEISSISATINRDTFVAYVADSGTTTLTYNGSAWSASPTLYGITVTGTPIEGDTITVVYVKENRGTIVVSTPTSFVSTGWNLYDNSKGYARAIKYDSTATFGVDGTYTKLQFSTTLTGTKSDITVSNKRFTVPSDGYIWVTGGNATDTCIFMTWTDWTEGYEGSWQAYTESTVDLSSLRATGHVFQNGMFQVGGESDSIDFDIGVATSYIERLAYNTTNLANAKASGRPYEYDTNYIYLVRETPVTETFTISKEYTASDHGIEFFTETEAPCYATMLYGHNLVEYLKHDVPEQLAQVSELQDELGIVCNGNKCAIAASAGQYIILKNSSISGCENGLYTAAQAIPANTAITSSYLTAVSGGGLNALNSKIENLPKKVVTIQSTFTDYIYNTWVSHSVTFPTLTNIENAFIGAISGASASAPHEMEIVAISGNTVSYIGKGMWSGGTSGITVVITAIGS